MMVMMLYVYISEGSKHVYVKVKYSIREKLSRSLT